MCSIRLEHVHFSYGKEPVVRDFSHRFEGGKITCLLGPSGSGKTTVLRLIAGLETPTTGVVYLENQPVSRDGKILVPPHQRGTGFIFQDLALWPHFTVYDNIAFGLKEQGQKNISRKVIQMLDVFGMAPMVKKYPHELSGGQKQMVAIARSLVLQPQILLMDEPLASIDAVVKSKILHHLRRLHQARPFTIIYVTHEHGEALSWSDYLAFMQQGQLVDSGTTSQMLHSRHLLLPTLPNT